MLVYVGGMRQNVPCRIGGHVRGNAFYEFFVQDRLVGQHAVGHERIFHMIGGIGNDGKSRDFRTRTARRGYGYEGDIQTRFHLYGKFADRFGGIDDRAAPYRDQAVGFIIEHDFDAVYDLFTEDREPRR